MKKAISILLMVLVLASCSNPSSRVDREIGQAERLMRVSRDSALTVLETIDPSELKTDSLKAKYHFLKAYAHLALNRSMVGDSLITFAHGYYRGKGIEREVRSGVALAMYRFWTGDTPGSISMLDSLAALDAVPDSLMVDVLRTRVLLGAAEYQGTQIIPPAKRLYAMEKDVIRKMEAKYVLMAGYEYAEKTDSALLLLDELIAQARSLRWSEKEFIFMVERAQLLTEAGRDSESDRLISEIIGKAGDDNGGAPLLYFQYTMNALNRGDIGMAARHLAVTDSLGSGLRGGDDAYFRSYSNLLHAIIDFKQTGRIKLMHINGQNNRQSERFNRAKASQWESERGALREQNRVLALKAESGRKTVVILVIAIFAVLIMIAAAWIITRRRQRERENEERAEALQKMVDELKSAPSQPQAGLGTHEALRRAMLQQLGIIKMVAETPTEQNREMLRRISSIESDTDGALVNWTSVFELIDTLYSGFHTKLHTAWGETLTLKEEQIIALMVAGFSTKEISVITGQTASTIYVRKSSIRKKLGVPEKQDIVAFLREEGGG